MMLPLLLLLLLGAVFNKNETLSLISMLFRMITGPVTVAINANPKAFTFYSNGVFSDPDAEADKRI